MLKNTQSKARKTYNFKIYQSGENFKYQVFRGKWRNDNYPTMLMEMQIDKP